MDPQSSTFRSPFTDSNQISPASSIHDIDPTGTPRSRLPRAVSEKPNRRSFITYKLQGEYARPWVGDARLKRSRYSNWIIWTFVILAFCLAAYINYSASTKVPKHSYCLILDEKFETLDPNVWNHEVQVDGFGNGCFDWTTTDEKNSFVDKDGLHIVPTLTTDTTSITRDQIYDGYTLNLTKAGGDGSCTGTTNKQCSIRSNGTYGTIIPPVRSARLNTRGKKAIRYGKVEIIAKMPRGDWLWPAIWMMPEDSVYGSWPRSGEIDLAELRGNDVNYNGGTGGRDTYLTTMHWGPTVNTDAYYKANKGRQIRRTDFSKGYHKFGLEWSKNYLFTYMDSRLQQVLYWHFDAEKDMYDRGNFATMSENYTLLANPWTQAPNNAPFDQSFYLILNVAVGSTNAWFPDGISDKPWSDGGNSASSFYKSIDTWYPTWPDNNDRGMTVKSVKMWQEGGCS